MTASGDDERIAPATAVDEVADRLRTLLYSGDIEPGARLRLRDLQDRFGVSHIPIREALRTLEGEGLVENQPQRGAVAARVSVQLLGEVYDTRRLLEPPLAGRAAVEHTAEDASVLSLTLDRLTRTEANAGDAFFDAHRAFHRAVMAPALNTTIEKILGQLWGVAERFVRISKTEFPADVNIAVTHHREIHARWLDKDPAVEDLVLEHLHITENVIRDHYQETR